MKKELVANNFKWLFSDKILEIGFGFILNVWIARVIGVDNFGRIAVVLAIMALVDPICNLCIRTKVVAMLVANQLKESYVLSNTFAITLAIVFSLLWYLNIVYYIHVGQLSQNNYNYIASTLPFKAFGFAEYYFESNSRQNICSELEKVRLHITNRKNSCNLFLQQLVNPSCSFYCHRTMHLFTYVVCSLY